MLKTIFRRLGLGRLLYLAWHAPRAAFERSRREGGPGQQWLTRRHRLAMISAAGALSPLPAAPDAPEAWFLTGRRFWYQTAFCFWSLARHAGRPLTPVLVDDGSIDDAMRAEATRLFPGAKFLPAADAEARLDAHLPAKKFPTLRSQRRTYLHLRKLTDVHAGHAGWRLVLDSDMLFFRRPDALLAWMDKPGQPVHMLDIQDAYGYPPATLIALAGAPLPANVNVGICGLRSDTLDWEKLEYWCARLLAEHGTSYYLEQALVALALTGQPAVRLPVHDYRLMPDDEECREPTAALHHYVAESKRGYFRTAWRAALTRATPPP